MRNHDALPGADDIARTAPNGIVVLVRENHNALGGADRPINAGSLYSDRAGWAGVSGIRTVARHPLADFSTIHEMLESNASLSISGGRHTAGFGGKSLAEDLPMLLDLLADALRTRRPTSRSNGCAARS